MALVELSRLFGKGFGDQGDDDGQAERGEGIPQTGHKFGISWSVSRVEELKVHVHTLIPLFPDGLDQLRHESVLHFAVIEGQVGQFIGKAIVPFQGGQMEQGLYPCTQGGIYQGLVLEWDECALGSKAVGKGGELGEVR